ncbi:M56 family metallopeptidase [Rhodanobacter umsongensis]|uniref:M56 family metallopeptidase n=1 Tax=Rhodanobacter umsongensis TaxID=633153 RepID=A0ABW0JPX3_9GAMM
MLLLIAFKSLLLAAGTMFLLRRMQNRSAADRSTVAHLGLLALVLLPLGSLLLPSIRLPSVWAAEASITGPIAISSATNVLARAGDGPASMVRMQQAHLHELSPTVTIAAAVLYFAPALILLASTLAALFRLAALRRRAEVLVNTPWLDALARAQRRMKIKSGTALLKSDDLSSPVSWGLMRPTILLNEATVRAPQQAEAVIAHELAHVLHFDWLKLIIARLAIAIFWFNPFAWALAREAYQLREELADDAVLHAEVAGPDYAELLIGMVRDQSRSRTLSAFHRIAAPRNSLHRRIERVLDASRIRTKSGTRWAVVHLVAMLSLAAPLAALTLTPRSKPAPLLRPSEAHQTGTFASSAVTPPHRVVPVLGVPPVRDASVAPSLRMSNAPVQATIKQNAPEPEERMDADQLVNMASTGITPAFKRAMADAGFPYLSADELADLRSFGVTPEYARALLKVGMPATWSDLSGARSLGLEPSYIDAMRGLGIAGSFSEFQTLWTFGVTPEVVRKIEARGIIVNSANQLLSLHAVGADQKP